MKNSETSQFILPNIKNTTFDPYQSTYTPDSTSQSYQLEQLQRKVQ